jgi:formylmethanofuran dehydrogenase subunit E
LYAADHATNMQDIRERSRGRGMNSDLTHCRKGHEFSPENTYVSPNGRRVCKACRRGRQRSWRKGVVT